MDIKKIFDKIELEKKKIEDIEKKEKHYITSDFKWRVGLIYSRLAIINKWRVYVAYGYETVFSKNFRKYEDAVSFYEKCVEEAKRRWENGS